MDRWIDGSMWTFPDTSEKPTMGSFRTHHTHVTNKNNNNKNNNNNNNNNNDKNASLRSTKTESQTHKTADGQQRIDMQRHLANIRRKAPLSPARRPPVVPRLIASPGRARGLGGP
jgi:septal ring-binding cell division protein DamX